MHFVGLTLFNSSIRCIFSLHCIITDFKAMTQSVGNLSYKEIDAK